MAKKTKGKRKNKYNIGITVAIAIAAALALGAGIWLAVTLLNGSEGPDETDTADRTEEEKVTVELVETDEIALGDGLVITDVGRYSGMFFEDGSDGIVQNVLMIVVKNTGKTDLQYTEITLHTEKGDGNFKLSTLPAGESAVVLEADRMQYVNGKYTAENKSTVFFENGLEKYEDVFDVSGLSGMLNVKNISDKDISGKIYIYYKNAASDIYYGGITYRATVDGLKSGELRQVVAKHFNPGQSEILFITYSQE